jgi:lysyl-tRNA synthetase class 1
VADARRWLTTYAPDHYRFEVRKSLPETAAALAPRQREYLGRVAEALSTRAWSGDEFHAYLHALKEEMGLSPREAFGAIYQAFLGKDSGPQAGWFLTALDPQFVLGRLREAARHAA